MVGSQFAYALNEGRIFIFHPDAELIGRRYVEKGCGTGKNVTNLECFFQPMSSCTFEDASAETADIEYVEGTNHRGVIPTVLQQNLEEELLPVKDLSNGFLKYWWRAQSAAYIMRINKETSDHLIDLRANKTAHHSWTNKCEAPGPVPYPLPAGTMNFHVRHGDKQSGK